MSTLLFDKIVFGPIHSRRLGVSLGMNLLPTDGKVCSFDCIYCECGFNKDRKAQRRMPTREEVSESLRERLTQMQADGVTPDVITFAGNGEPTLHSDFEYIIADTIATRDALCPKAKIAVLSNATQLHKESVCRALNRVDDNILKIDSVLDSRIRQIDRPHASSFSFAQLLEQLKRFDGNLMIQTMFLKGDVDGQPVNNMTEEEITGWLDALRQIAPKQVMIYTIDRETPAKGLLKATHEELDGIAERVRQAGFNVSVSY